MVKWTPNAQDDLDEIREYIARNFNVDLALKTVDDLINYTEMILSAKPLAGTILATNPLFSKLVFEGNSI